MRLTNYQTLIMLAFLGWQPTSTFTAGPPSPAQILRRDVRVTRKFVTANGLGSSASASTAASVPRWASRTLSRKSALLVLSVLSHPVAETHVVQLHHPQRFSVVQSTQCHCFRCRPRWLCGTSVAYLRRPTSLTAFTGLAADTHPELGSSVCGDKLPVGTADRLRLSPRHHDHGDPNPCLAARVDDACIQCVASLNWICIGI